MDGSGAGVTINPVAFLVIQPNNVKLMPVNHASSIDKLLDYVPDLIEKTNNMLNKHLQNKKEETQGILKEMQKRQKETVEKQNKKKKEVEDKIEKTAKKVKREEIVIEPDEDYEFEYDESLEDLEDE